MKMGKVFYSDGSGNARPKDPSIVPGWYYQIDMAEPIGPFDTQLDAGCAARAIIAASPPSGETDRARIVARILSEHGLHVSSPDDGDLDDVERERWNACVEIVRALLA